MKEANMLGLVELVNKHIFYKDGFWIYKECEEDYGSIVEAKFVRDFIKRQGIPILERDVTTLLDELTFNEIDFDINGFIKKSIMERAEYGESKYFKNLDRLYPGNKFREIMNYYLFGDDCYCFILVGYGQTGKTTFVNIISKIIGEAISGRSNVALLRGSHGTAILEGKAFFEVNEAQDLDLDTANMLKGMITNDDLYINPKFQTPRTITPHLKMIMTCNNVPRFKVSDDGVIRRFITLEMNKKLPQNKNFMRELEEDIPKIIGEAMLHPFRIEDFAKERYYLFEHDPQYGFGYGEPNKDYEYRGISTYECYAEMCRVNHYGVRNRANFEKFIELANIYGKEAAKCVTTSKGSMVENGLNSLDSYELEDLPF